MNTDYAACQAADEDTNNTPFGYSDPLDRVWCPFRPCIVSSRKRLFGAVVRKKIWILFVYIK